ncbi:acyl- synthetase [Cryptosporidium xiaoi]|uniref:Acyl- synthetase n=1 Tax=Cryptosporidium xiaoi TaxID=659607 RepID=A0AAV9Y1D0_9CRYT
MLSGREATDYLYSVPLKGGKVDNDSSPIYRNPNYPSGELSNIEGLNSNNLWEFFLNSVKKYKNNDCLGVRRLNEDGSFGKYVFKTYNEVMKISLNVGINIAKLKLCPVQRYEDNDYQKELSIMGILSKNREEWYLIEHACNAFGICLAPLYDTLGDQSLKYILNKTKLKTLCISDESIEKIISMVENSQSGYLNIENIICFDPIKPEMKERCDKVGINIIQFSELKKKVSIQDMENYKPRNASPDEICSIHFTSGTTGFPKGAMLTHRCFMACVKSCFEQLFSANGISLGTDDAHLSYLPLAHIFERLIIMNAYHLGIPIGIFSGNVSRVMSDSQELKPTILICVPQVLSRIIHSIEEKMSDSNIILKTVFNKALSHKEHNLKMTGNPTHWLWDKILFNNTKKILGGRLKAIVSGAAPLSIDVNYKIQALFCCKIIEGFGMSECIATLSTRFSSNAPGTVGGPFGDIEVKLTSLVEMGYDATKRPRRGILKIRGNSVFKGYFCDQENTKNTIDQDGWLDTGDIAEKLPDGSFRIIDRKKALFKLAQGEYISPEKIEGIYLTSTPLVQQVYVYGKSTDRFLVALVFPNEASIKKWGENNNKQGLSFEELCQCPELYDEISSAFRRVENSSKLFGFEKIHKFKIIPKIMNSDNGLLTPTMKIIRSRVDSEFKDSLDYLRSQL